MWILRILSGPQAGKMLRLKAGSYSIGRGAHCSVTLNHPGISKEHAQLDILNDKIVLTDLDSRNGTFLNGVKIKKSGMQLGDRFSVGDILAEIVPEGYVSPQQQLRGANPYSGNLAQQSDASPEQRPEEQSGPSELPQAVQGFLQNAKVYIHTVVLPGVYKLAEWMEFKTVIGLFLMIFILSVTGLSTIPLIRILKSSIESESQARARTIARQLARNNQQALLEGARSVVSVEEARNEKGVTEALIISRSDGSIISPPDRAGQFPDLPFVVTAIKNEVETVEQIDSNTIGAVVPIAFYNPNIGQNQITAYAAIIYDMGSLAVNDGRTLSLFVQTLFIALIVGLLLYFFLYSLIVFPYRQINKKMDEALRRGVGDIRVDYQLPELQHLISNINSIISRAGAVSSEGEGPAILDHDRTQEIHNLVQLFGFPSLAVSAWDNCVRSANSTFEERTGQSLNDIVNQSIEQINDQALKLSLIDLMGRVLAQPDAIASNQLEFSGYNYDIAAQAIWGLDKVAYVLFVLLPASPGGE